VASPFDDEGVMKAMKRLAGEPIVYENPHLGIKASFQFNGMGHLAAVAVTCPCGEEATFTDFSRKDYSHALKFFHIREWINALTDDELHEIGRAWDAAFRNRGPGRMRAQESVRAALFRYAPEFSRE